MLILHPKTWLVLGMSAFLLAMAPLHVYSSGVLLAVEMMLLVLAGQGRRYAVFLLGLVPIALIALVIQSVSFQGEVVYARWSPLPGMNFMVTAEGLILGARLALQILCFGTGCALFTLTTTPAGIRAALTDWKVPPRLVYLLVASLNAPVQLRRYAGIAKEATVARGIAQRTAVQRSRAVLQVGATLFTLILLENEDRARSLQQRGIELAGHRVMREQWLDSLAQKVMRWGVPVLAVVLVALAFRGVL